MIFSYKISLVLSIACLFFCNSAIADKTTWPWAQTNYLTRSNWSSLLIPHTNSLVDQHSVWFIFYYLNYCGHCQKVEPIWERIGQLAQNWSKYIQIGAYDCVKDSSPLNDICQDKTYPQWRIFCPLTNSTQLAFESDRRTNQTNIEDILRWLLTKTNEISKQCYGTSWPIFKEIQAKTIDELKNFIPKSIEKFQIFVSNDDLQYALYVLNNSAIVQAEPIYHLRDKGKILNKNGIWKGIRNENGQLTLQLYKSEEKVESLILNSNFNSKSENTTENQNLILKPTYSDIDSAIIWMVNRDLPIRLPDLTANVKQWIEIVYEYYPGSSSMKLSLLNLHEFLQNHTNLSANDFRNYTKSISTMNISNIKFEHCNGSDSSKRGYPCSLWILFHSLTVKQAMLSETHKLSSKIKPYELFVAIREYIREFFRCDECVKHFTNMTSNAENEIHSFYESVVYLWQKHNIVNKRLRYEEYSLDPNWPKIPFPSQKQCQQCTHQVDTDGDVSEYHEIDVYNYLKDFYSFQNSSQYISLNLFAFFLLYFCQYLINIVYF